MTTLDRILDAMDSDFALFAVVGIISISLMLFLGYVFATLGAR